MTADTARDDTVRVWFVERTYSDDEQNLIILTYATSDGEWEFRKERALSSFSGDDRETYAALEVDRDNLSRVGDPEQRERFAAEAARIADEYEPDQTV